MEGAYDLNDFHDIQKAKIEFSFEWNASFIFPSFSGGFRLLDLLHFCENNYVPFISNKYQRYFSNGFLLSLASCCNDFGLEKIF